MKAFRVQVCIGAVLLAILSGCDRPRVERGEIDGALFMYAVPNNWDGRLLMIAHGHQPEDSTLSGDFDLKTPRYGDLVDDGWLVARTSYRRPGRIIEDGIEDLENLLAHIEHEEGAANLKLLEGTSMGGLNAVLLMEKSNPVFDGAYAMGAAIYLDYDGWRRDFTNEPQGPLLLVSNPLEYDRSEKYYKQAVQKHSPVALWKISRPGHVNIGYLEQHAAVEGLENWIQTGEIEMCCDATMDAGPEASTAVRKGGYLSVKVMSVDATYGNMMLDVIKKDFEEIGLKGGEVLEVRFGDTKVKVKLGAYYFDVVEGDWVLFETADGYYRMGRNNADAREIFGNIKKRKKIVIGPKVEK